MYTRALRAAIYADVISLSLSRFLSRGIEINLISSAGEEETPEPEN